MNFWLLRHLLLFWFNKPAIQARMLKKTNCNLYYAEFSIIHRNTRFTQGVSSPVLHLINLLECLTKSVVHTTCFSVNYCKSNETCELVEFDLYRSGAITDKMINVAPGWMYYNTKEKKAVRRDICG